MLMGMAHKYEPTRRLLASSIILGMSEKTLNSNEE